MGIVDSGDIGLTMKKPRRAVQFANTDGEGSKETTTRAVSFVEADPPEAPKAAAAAATSSTPKVSHNTTDTTTKDYQALYFQALRDLSHAQATKKRHQSNMVKLAQELHRQRETKDGTDDKHAQMMHELATVRVQLTEVKDRMELQQQEYEERIESLEQQVQEQEMQRLPEDAKQVEHPQGTISQVEESVEIQRLQDEKQQLETRRNLEKQISSLQEAHHRLQKEHRDLQTRSEQQIQHLQDLNRDLQTDFATLQMRLEAQTRLAEEHADLVAHSAGQHAHQVEELQESIRHASVTAAQEQSRLQQELASAKEQHKQVLERLEEHLTKAQDEHDVEVVKLQAQEQEALAQVEAMKQAQECVRDVHRQQVEDIKSQHQEALEQARQEAREEMQQDHQQELDVLRQELQQAQECHSQEQSRWEIQSEEAQQAMQIEMDALCTEKDEALARVKEQYKVERQTLEQSVVSIQERLEALVQKRKLDLEEVKTLELKAEESLEASRSSHQEEMESVRDTHQQEVEEIKAQHQEALEQAHQAACEQAENAEQDHQRNLATLRQQLQQAQERHSQEQSRRQAKMEDMQSEMDALRTEKDEALARVKEKYEVERKNLEQSVVSVQERLEALVQTRKLDLEKGLVEVKTLKRKAEVSLKATRSSHQEEMEALRNSCDDQVEQMQAEHAHQVAELQEKIQALTTQTSRLQEELLQEQSKPPSNGHARELQAPEPSWYQDQVRNLEQEVAEQETRQEQESSQSTKESNLISPAPWRFSPTKTVNHEQAQLLKTFSDKFIGEELDQLRSQDENDELSNLRERVRALQEEVAQLQASKSSATSDTHNESKDHLQIDHDEHHIKQLAELRTELDQARSQSAILEQELTQLTNHRRESKEELAAKYEQRLANLKQRKSLAESKQVQQLQETVCDAHTDMMAMKQRHEDAMANLIQKHRLEIRMLEEQSEQDQPKQAVPAASGAQQAKSNNKTQSRSLLWSLLRWTLFLVLATLFLVGSVLSYQSLTQLQGHWCSPIRPGTTTRLFVNEPRILYVSDPWWKSYHPWLAPISDAYCPTSDATLEWKGEKLYIKNGDKVRWQKRAPGGVLLQAERMYLLERQAHKQEVHDAPWL